MSAIDDGSIKLSKRYHVLICHIFERVSQRSKLRIACLIVNRTLQSGVQRIKSHLSGKVNLLPKHRNSESVKGDLTLDRVGSGTLEQINLRAGNFCFYVNRLTATSIIWLRAKNYI